jgi:hypothetical protein
MRLVIRPILAALSAAALVSCVDGTAPAGRRSSLAIMPHFSQAATRASATLAQAGLTYNATRIVIVRPATDTLKDTTIVFSPTSNEVTLELSVAAVPSEDLTATVEFKQDGTVMFSGTTSVKALALTSASTATPIEIEVNYTGPGSTATSVTVTPGAGVYSASSNTQFTAKAFDGSNAEVVGAPIFWSVSDESKATISSTGLLTPTGQRGTVEVTATAASGVSKTISVQLAAAATGLRVIQGAGQKGQPGSQLATAAIVELVGADGLPAASTGQTVTFSASAGASITPTTTTLDANGRASATMTVGSTAGTTYIYTATVGAFSVSWGGSATPGTPTHFVTNTSTTLAFPAGSVPNPFPTLRVADALENSVSGVILKVTIKENGVILPNNPFQIPADTVGILEVNRVTSPLTKASNYTVLVEAADPALSIPSVTYDVTVQPAAAAKLAFTQQPPTTASNGQTMTIKVTIQDQYGNTVTSGSPSNINLSVAPGQTGWNIAGTGSVAPVSGVATFGIQVNNTSGATKNGAQIQAVGASLPAVLSAGFVINP